MKFHTVVLERVGNTQVEAHALCGIRSETRYCLDCRCGSGEWPGSKRLLA
jgi:hypothetical protein